MRNKNTTKLINKWIGLFTVLLLLLQATVNAGYYLPESSTWWGSREYDKDNVHAYVEYAVYDTQSSSDLNALNGLLDETINNLGSDRYIYAYKALNIGDGLPPITVFELLGGNPSAANNIGSQDDGQGGLIPSNDGASFVWQFENGVFVAEKYSAFMVFSSDSGPVAGQLKLSTLGNSGDEPPTVPEPTTITLLCAGSLALLKRKNRRK